MLGFVAGELLQMALLNLAYSTFFSDMPSDGVMERLSKIANFAEHH